MEKLYKPTNYVPDLSSLRTNTNDCYYSPMTPRSYSNQQQLEEGMALPHNNKNQVHFINNTLNYISVTYSYYSCIFFLSIRSVFIFKKNSLRDNNKILLLQ